MSNVKLAIRVRPFTEREMKSEKDRIPVVNVTDDHTVTITNVKVSASGAGDSRERVRRYYADYTLDSSCAATDPSYATQEKVFESIGREVLSSVYRGSSACVLAYGQSATGKTHTMMGTEDQPGLVPRLCRAFAQEQDSLDVTVSFLEIYNERVHDLLAGEPLPCHSLPRRRGNSRKDLRVREHPERGPYVQNLRRVAVTDVETLLSLVEEGARRRRTAATRRNFTSSRSHALLELATPKATLHLADLAGSEKASWEGCEGGRQKEGANINKSLVALSNVISALVSGGSRGRFVPYRDSALTWLLRDCFTGGASTFIIATVSPSVACYGESASTLRWAERARQLRTPRLHPSGTLTASRAALQAQLNQLLAELAKHHIRYNLQTGKIAYDEQHWSKLTVTSTTSKNAAVNEAQNKDVSIGNLLDMLNPKIEAQTSQNSESTASSVASGSSDILNTIDKNIKEEINKEVDKLLTPAFERTRSGSDLGAIAPLRHRRRQYKSQEVLSIDKTLQAFQTTEQPSPNQSREDITESQESESLKPLPVTILYDNQRAEIVASVTDRLYSKLKKKEEAAVSKMENLVDKKIMEPLSELRICTNARQRLMEISQKTMRNKGRRIGIPAFTQTRFSATRVRDQGVDVQTDLESYISKNDRSFTLQRDVATETVPMTPRCKEVAAGPKSSSLNYRDRGTLTETDKIVHKNSFMMTDAVVKCDRCSQTTVIPPPRRKRRASMHSKCNEHHHCYVNEYAMPSVISINISQPYLDSETETQSSDDKVERLSSDDNSGEVINSVEERQAVNVSSTPDLLTNHNNIETSVNENSEYIVDDMKLSGSNELSQILPSQSNVVLLPKCHVKTKLDSNNANISNTPKSYEQEKIKLNVIDIWSAPDFCQKEHNNPMASNTISSSNRADNINSAWDLPNENYHRKENCQFDHVNKFCDLEFSNSNEEFPEEIPEITIPRVTVASASVINQDDMKEIVLGRGENIYPYSKESIISPRNDTQRILKFKERPTAEVFGTQLNWESTVIKNKQEFNSSDTTICSEKDDGNNTDKESIVEASDTADFSQVETNSFIWKKCNTSKCAKSPRSYTTIKNLSKSRSARSKIYREFLGLNIDNKWASETFSPQISSSTNAYDGSSTESIDYVPQNSFQKRRQYFEDKCKIPDANKNFDRIKNKILDSCNSLDVAVNKYENYLTSFNENKSKIEVPMRTPKEYLQHLIQLRREFVRAEYDTTDSSVGISRK